MICGSGLCFYFLFLASNTAVKKEICNDTVIVTETMIFVESDI